MKKFKYKMVKMSSPMPVTSVENQLNELGEDGWELTAIDYKCFILKREVTVSINLSPLGDIQVKPWRRE